MKAYFSCLCRSKSGKGVIVYTKSTKSVTINGRPYEMTSLRTGLLWADHELFEGVSKGEEVELDGLRFTEDRAIPGTDICWVKP